MTLHVLQTKPLPKGSDEYEARKAEVLKAFAASIPEEYHLPKETIDNAPSDVTGIPSTCGLLTPEELHITETYDATSLAEAIAARKLTAVAVARAFSKRAIVAHQLTCCLTQWFMDSAIAQAEELDAHLAKHGTTVGPLHGVPMSIKDHIPLAGTFSSSGYLASIVKDEEDAPMVAILRAAGAVFYCKTNQPQSLMHLESASHWGRALCPSNTALSAGGSSGGEAALVAMRGSVLGVGSDIGGSVRGPAAFCGVVGFKATAYVLPMFRFLASPFAGELQVLCSTGPICRSVADADLFMRTISAAKPYLDDPRLVPIPWTGLSTPTPRLKVGIVSHDGFITPQPPITRALDWAREQLKQIPNIEIKEFHPYGAKEAWEKARRFYWTDGGHGLRSALESSGEPVLPLSEWIWRDAEAGGMQTVAQAAQNRTERDAFRIAFAKSWNEQDVDVILGPTFVGPACAHDTAFYWTYTSLYNLVDYPGLVIPTPIRAEKGEKYPEGYQPLGEECAAVKKLWDEGNFDAAPAALQLVARKYHDNELFGAVGMMKTALGL